MDFGLSTRTLDSLQEIFQRHPKIDKVVIYGSRAMGTHKEGSDIDLTMQGDELSFRDLARISGEITDSSIPHEADLSIFNELENAKLLDHIERVGLVFYEKHRDANLGTIEERNTFKLEDIKIGAEISGIKPNEVVRIVQVETVSDDAITVYYKDSRGKLDEQMLFRSDEERLESAKTGQPWVFDAPGAEFKLGLEAYRISQAVLFDPMMAVHTSNVEPLPHQISAVYESMLPKQPLRFVLADDPGAGKTVMAGLLTLELIMRGDAKRVLIVCPGSLAEQWQDELREKFGLTFEIFSREKQEQSPSGNFFAERDQLICRLDQISRDPEFQEKLKNTLWDIIIVDEAHKMSAKQYGKKVDKTKRFQLGELLGSVTRHFLLMTATPHNGKDEDFQIWLSLLDNDRFYGRFRESGSKPDVSDMMRRMVKEELLRFDGTRLFPERRAYTVNYKLSAIEATLYEDVTTYVGEEMNRADKLDNEKKRNNVGFALTILQRRLASSPEAIYQSLQRRHKRLEERLEDNKRMARGQTVRRYDIAQTLSEYGFTTEVELPDSLDKLDEDLSAEEHERFEAQVVDQASAAKTIPELEAEIDSLKTLENQALKVVQSGNDKKWEELSSLLQSKSEMFTNNDARRKLIIFTEHKDTLNYLVERVGDMLGNANAVRTIHGGINRNDRRKIQEEFRNDPEVTVLIATDAAGEGINLQNANLMINYDLPWNPNRLEQRFGRIHRIGQTEVCHLWNMVAKETREGQVFDRLFEKMEIAKKALGGRVFDVLGEAFEGVSLRDLLVKAIRDGEAPETKQAMEKTIDGALDQRHLKEVLERNALVEQHMGLQELYAVKEEMEKAEARKLQPYFIRAFFTEAFQTLAGEMRDRESGRFEIPYVPAAIRNRDQHIGRTRIPVLKKYDRICFEKHLVRYQGKPMADMIHPAHPLMHAVTDLVLEAHSPKLKQGAILVDPNDESLEPKALFIVDHTIKESLNAERIASRRLQFVEVDKNATAKNAGWAPHLDLQTIDDADRRMINDILQERQLPWLTNNLEAPVLEHVSKKLVPEHYKAVKDRRERQADKTLAAVHDRLVKAISYLADRYMKLQDDVKAGKQPAVQLEMARREIDELRVRLEQRTTELEASKNVVSSTPVIIGGALVIPQGLLAHRKGETQFSVDAEARSRVERIAMEAVMEIERGFGFEVTDVGDEKCGWDITSRPPANKDKSIKPDRHIEVKGRAKGQNTITVSRNEIIYGLNQADKFILAIVIVDGETFEGPHYIKKPFTEEPGIGVASINYKLNELLLNAKPPKQTI